MRTVSLHSFTAALAQMGPYETRLISVATERERQLTTARANQTTGLTNDTAANWAPEVEFSPYRAPSCRQETFPFGRQRNVQKLKRKQQQKQNKQTNIT